MGGCLFIFLNIGTNAIGSSWMGNLIGNLITSTSLVTIKKYFFRRNVNYITYDYPYPNMAGYWKRHLLRHHVYLYFHGICTYNYK